MHAAAHRIEGLPAAERRRRVRLAAAGLAAATTAIYLLIGLEVLRVVDRTAADAPPMLTFGAPAAAAFALGVILLLLTDHRLVWALGALLQVVVIVMYVVVAPNRTPPFELWGVMIKVLQALLLAALVYLAVTPTDAEAERAARA